MTTNDTAAKLAAAVKERDALFREMARKYKSLTYTQVSAYESQLEQIARRIAGLKGAITRGT